MDSAVNTADGGSQSALSMLAGYGLAVAAVATALALTFFIRQASGNPTFFLFYVAIFVSVWFGSRGSGWLATALAIIALQSLFRDTGNLLAMTGERLPTVLGFITCMVTADIVSTQRHRAERALRSARDRLEIAVAERTAELRRANADLSEEIAERKRAEAAARASEERWHRLFAASSAGMALTDLTSRYVATNSAFRDMLGYTDEELKTLTALDLTHPEERASSEARHVDFVRGARQEYQVDKRYMKKDGTPLWMNVTTTYLPETDVTPPMLQCIYINIDDRKRAEEALRASEDRWRRLFAASSAGMALNDLTGRYIATNSAFQKMLGYSDEELKTLTAIDITHPDDKPATEAVFADYASGARQENHVDKRYMKKDGTPLWVNVTSTFVPVTDGSRPMLQGIYVNIDDRKRAEQALRSSEERWRTVFETSSVGIATSDENLRIATANAAFQRMVGYSESELRGMRWIDLTHDEDRSATDDLVRSLLDGQILAYNMEKRYRRKDGQTIWVNVYNTLVPATATTPAFFPAIIIDITDRVRAEAALQRLQAELARVARVTTMGELATSIAHEINQPLAAIVASSNACRRWLEGQNLSRAKESLERVIADAVRACEVIKRVRVLTSNATPERLEVNVNAVLKEVLAITRGELQARQVSLQLELNEDVPAVIGDKVQLQQVVLNLVMNAIEAMAAVTGRRRVLTIKSQCGEDSGALVTIQDCGTGLDLANAERIFQPFFTTKPGGMGMGLSISTSIMETHGGRLWASPAHPCGTAFHFSLPAAGRSDP